MAESEGKTAEGAEKVDATAAIEARVTEAKPAEAKEVTDPVASEPRRAEATGAVSVAKVDRPKITVAPEKPVVAAPASASKDAHQGKESGAGQLSRTKPAEAKSTAKMLKKGGRPTKSKTAKSAKSAKAAPAPAKAALKKSLPKPTVAELKEKIMDKTSHQADYSKVTGEAINEIQLRAKKAYEKSTAMAGEFSEFAKGNAEAVVESGRILAGGVQELGQTYVQETRTAYETMTADLKEAAAVKSPTELFQLQGRLMRRNFDTMVAYSSKNSEAMLKLASDAFAPISTRLSVAAERVSKIG